MKAIERAPRQQQAIDKEIKKAHSFLRSMRIKTAMKRDKLRSLSRAIDEDDIEENVTATLQAHQQACNAFESHKDITLLYDQRAKSLIMR